jgi:hypothetical protein
MTVTKPEAAGPMAMPFSEAKRADVFERDDGRYQIGIADDAPAFESRAFAEQVAVRGASRVSSTR